MKLLSLSTLALAVFAVASAQPTTPTNVSVPEAGVASDIPVIVQLGKDAVLDITNLINDFKAIKASGFTRDLVQQALGHLQSAIGHGVRDVGQAKTILDNIKNLLQNGGTPADAAEISSALQKIVQLYFPTKMPTNSTIADDIQKAYAMGAELRADFEAIVKDLQRIAAGGLTPELTQSILGHLQTAWSHGLNNLKDGKKIVDDIKAIVQGGGVDIKDGVAITNAIQSVLQQFLLTLDPNPKVCIRDGVGRGFGTPVVNQCLEGEEAYGALCYPKCKEGYEKVGCCLCRKKGCSGAEGVTDVGASCTKPKAYGRGAGYTLWNQDKCNAENNGQCEKNGLMWYPKCKPGYHNFGCCICTPDCPAGTTDDGAFCRKDHYGRGVGVSRLGCDKGLEKSGLFCYKPCAPGYKGVGPMCWPQCPPSIPSNCGLFCTSTSATCASSAIEIIGSVAKIALSAVNNDTAGAISTGIQAGAKVITLEKCPKP
ncbi:hypothetical protein SPRG_12769 [Saprolegnia parasitica CBS 223.65]|uniref:Secreted protein n=1 Tax=Saprolegnia parasitica (strain CBS 223.65) TaxID=695850 RepID=A0A067C683_SAPPC|nr:hypothetical protein SPRG_12769 [Saprolegnia parasitica CBS 223.65]KDO22307.1 hypothetical protein SPRG_12769 [Saprolegnia parasitica CBS 223.65]|eukprot:XP_012206943.1 hypothetical protein SPRG_12769 [Saprolegnia parasitica CBS 223.65]